MPTLFEWPAKIVGNHNITEYPAVSTDILPTVLEVLGVKSAHPTWKLDGISLVYATDLRFRLPTFPLYFVLYQVFLFHHLFAVCCVR
jgi:arylsulfatase A-like enzyme